MLARIRPSSTVAGCSSAKKAKLDDKSDAKFEHQWTYSILDYRREPTCPSGSLYHMFESRLTVDSFILRSRVSFKFYGIVDDKIKFKYAIMQTKVADEKDSWNYEGEYASQFLSSLFIWL